MAPECGGESSPSSRLDNWRCIKIEHEYDVDVGHLRSKLE